VRVWLQLAPSLCGAKTVEVLFLDGISGHVGRHGVLSGLVSHPRRIIRLLQQHFFFVSVPFLLLKNKDRLKMDARALPCFAVSCTHSILRDTYPLYVYFYDSLKCIF
jgi:hypothetical protein